MSENVLRQGLTRYLSPARLEALRAARVAWPVRAVWAPMPF